MDIKIHSSGWIAPLLDEDDGLLNRKGFVLIFLAAAFVRLVNLWMMNDLAHHAFIEDSNMFWMGAEFWRDAGYFAKLTPDGYSHDVERMPGYFLFLLGARTVFGDSVLYVLLLQSLIDAGTCCLIAAIGA